MHGSHRIKSLCVFLPCKSEINKTPPSTILHLHRFYLRMTCFIWLLIALEMKERWINFVIPVTLKEKSHHLSRCSIYKCMIIDWDLNLNIMVVGNSFLFLFLMSNAIAQRFINNPYFIVVGASSNRQKFGNRILRW